VNARTYTHADGSAPYTDHAALGHTLELTPEMQEQLDQLARAAKLIDDIKPDYAIRLMFKDRSQRGPFLGLMTVWQHGGLKDGGGEQLVYFCTRPVEKNGQTKLCSSPLPPYLLGNEVAVCPACKQPSRPDQLCGQVLSRTDLDGWTQLLHKVFLALNCSADIRVTLEGGSLIQADEQEHMKAHNGDVLNAVRASRRTIIYSLKRIVEDTSAGSAVLTRFKAFLGA
jgi:hypothetical protein